MPVRKSVSALHRFSLNESPSKKEGKSPARIPSLQIDKEASMKAPPRRKGNTSTSTTGNLTSLRLNESPSKKEGKYLPR